jgi:lysozyme
VNIGEGAIGILKHYEQGPHGGPALQTYYDSAGVATIGWGHKILSWEDYTTGITAEEADAILENDVAKTVYALNGLLQVDVTQNQFDAMLCLAFNIGITAFRTSTLLRKVNTGDTEGAAQEFLVWDKAHVDGKLVVLSGLLDRRQTEQGLFQLV